MSLMASQITSLTIVYSPLVSGTDLKKNPSKPRVTGLCEGNSPETGEFPAQKASNAENVSIWWRHHDVNQWILFKIPSIVVIDQTRDQYILMFSHTKT